MRRIAVIPARGGSKRLPRKNIIDFKGKPMIAYTIEAANASGLFDCVVVSTEDAQIAKICESFGAEVVIRPMELAKDTARVVDVCIHILDVKAAQGRNYDILCCLYATAPLRTARDLENICKLVQSRECDFAMAITEYHYHPHQAMIINEKDFMKPMWPGLVEQQRQTTPKMYIDNGSTYVARIPEFLKFKTFRGPNLKGYFMPRNRSVDVDTVEDLELAKYFAEKFLK